MHRHIQRIALLCLSILIFSMPAHAENRVALVVGNSDYAYASKLSNPPNDAEDMAKALGDLGFQVISAINVDKGAFDAKLRDFARALRNARMALFFYAGHGMQVAGKNYAIPLDAKLESAADLPVETVDIDRILAVMQADETRVNLVFLDACRDNPLVRSFARALPLTRSSSVGAGLSPVDASRGTLIAYATAPNRVAIDGRGRNSPFTAALLRHIHTPGLDIALVMRRVTAEVEAASGGTQVPWVHASLTTDVVLKSADGSIASPPPTLANVSPFVVPPLSPAPKIDAPNEPLPSNLPLSTDVLKLVETHRFFAEAPPVLGRFYDVRSSNTTHMRGPSATVDADSATSVRWLRSGIVRLEKASTEVTKQSGTSTTTTRREINLSAANGLIELANSNTASWKGGAGTSSSKLLSIENLRGQVFPVVVGNQFSYRATYLHPHMKDQFVTTQTCQVTKSYEGRSFHPNLNGRVLLATCETDSGYKKNKRTSSTGMWHSAFIEAMGLWIDAGPIAPGERIASAYRTSLTETTYSYVLKSFELTR